MMFNPLNPLEDLCRWLGDLVDIVRMGLYHSLLRIASTIDPLLHPPKRRLWPIVHLSLGAWRRLLLLAHP